MEEDEDQDQTQINQVLDKWFALQQIIKEGITLNEIIENQKKENKNLLITKYYDYFQNKLIIRELMEKSITIDSNSLNISPSEANQGLIKTKPNKYISFQLIRKETESILGDAFIAVEKLIYLLRNDFQFILKIASLTEMELKLDNKDIDPNSIVDLFCHQFYENLLIPNPEHEELLILCSLLLEQEIKNMTTMSISSFIDEHSTFLGKFLKSYTKKPELKSYLSITLGSIILKVENSGEFFMDMNPAKIMKNIGSWENNSKGLYANLEQQNRTTSDMSEANTDTSIYYQEYIKAKDKERDETNFLIPILMKQKNYNEDPRKIKEFVEDITQEDLIQRIIDEKDENIKEFYKRQIERLGNDKDIYTCTPFLESLNQFSSKDKILLRYVKNYEIIKCLIDNIMQSLLSSVTTIPYSLRCICKIICILIQKRFPNISTYERNAFIGEFIFGKCILPILVDCDNNGVITSSILSSNIRDCLKIAAKVLIKVSRGLLFDSCIDINLTIFNHYITQIIPEMNRFCNQLIKVKLPRAVNDLINGKIDYSSMSKYHYFDQNKEELINLQCVCFSIEDILTIIGYIQPVLDTVFKPPNTSKSKESLFYKTMQKLISNKGYLKNTFSKSKKKQFFILFQEEENPYKEELLKMSQTKFTFFTNQDTSNLILSKIKYCIIVILQELNLINNKVYSYLNQANSNLNFFKAINQTLQIEEYAIDTENDKIPLNWYSLYMISNLIKLDEKYKENDFACLYDELYDEECKMINVLKIKSNLLITKYGMNIRCAETLSQKAKTDLLRAEKILKIIKTKKLIENDLIEVCVSSKNPFNDTNSLNNSNLNMTSTGMNNNVVVIHKSRSGNKKKMDKDGIAYCNTTSNIGGGNNSNAIMSINVVTIDQCVHDKPVVETNPRLSIKKTKSLHLKTNPNHIKSIKEFIKLFVLFREVKEDIYQGKQIHNVAKSLTNYLMILHKMITNEPLFQNLEEINYINEKIRALEGEKRNPGLKEEIEKLKKEKSTCNDNVKKEIDEIIEKIRHFIMLRLYIKIYPENPLIQDIEFYNKVRLISWITPEHLEIKKVFQNEKLWELAMKSINKMDAGRTPQEKLNCISNAYGIINRSIKFCSGNEKDSGAEELTPIFQFILIKALPRRLFSNIHYIKGICDSTNDDDPLKGPREFFLGQVEAAVVFIHDMNYTCLKISKEEYDKNMELKAAEYKFNLQQSSSSGSSVELSNYINSQPKMSFS